MNEPKPIVPFTPVPVPARHDGWTVARQEAFLKALAACGCVTDACRAVGMSRESARLLYNRPGAAGFRRAWEAALDCAAPLVETGAWERAVKGVARPIFFQGEQVGEYRHYDERLTMFLLRYRRAHRYGSQLDRLPPLPPPLRPPGMEDDGPDPDEAIGTLDWHLDDLVDEADLPGGLDETSRARLMAPTLPTSSPSCRAQASDCAARTSTDSTGCCSSAVREAVPSRHFRKPATDGMA